MSQSMPTKSLGKDGPLVPFLGFGLMGIAGFYGDIEPDEQRFKVLDRAYELGSRHWDTSDLYGDSEVLIGKWFKLNPEKRKDIFLATKFGAAKDSNGNHVIKSDPEHVKNACESSLKRLGVESIDLYYCHRVDMKTPIEKTAQAMVDLKSKGKIKYLGFSELSAQSLRRAHSIHPVSALQMEYSPFSMEIESPEYNILATCRELGVALVAYSPLGRGFISGQYRSPDDFSDDDFRKKTPRYSKENFHKNLELADKFKSLANEKDCTPSQLCLAWLLAQGDDIFPIPGTKKIKYLEDNIGAVNVRLTQQENDELRKLVEATEVHGARAPEVWLKDLLADTPPLS